MDAPFVMELPPYRVPMFKSLLIHMWDRSKMFLKKMGGIILIGSVIIWILSSFPRNIDYTKDYSAKIEEKKQTYQQMSTMSDQQQLEQLRQEHERQIYNLQQQKRIEATEKSYIGYIGKSIAPIFAPLGIDWRGSVALLTGFVAKEIVVSTMGVLYAGEDDEGEALKTALKQAGMTPLSALGMMFFVLLYVPCLATVVTIRKETLSWRWALFSVVYSTILAWITAFVIYQGGNLLGLG
jgi:ferrous iron transport protein B